MGRALRAALLALALAAPAQAERIRSFEVEISLDPDGSFLVTESIAYDFGPLQRHGIFRDIPVLYSRDAVGRRRMRLEVEAVTDAKGAEQPYQISRSGASLRIRIGDPRRTVTGLRHYRLRYRVGRAIQYLEAHDELYWNATGNGWPVPMERAGAVVRLPATAAAATARLACFTGAAGSRAAACRAERRGDAVRFEAEGGFAPGEGLTLVVGLPKGVLREPAAWARLLDTLRDYGGAWLLLPFAALAGMTRLWRSRGRDPVGREAIPVRYEPPEGLTPAEVGVVADERADLEDVTATILDLAVRGHLEIQEIESSRFLFLSDRDYRLQRRSMPAGDLRLHESRLLGALFGGGETLLVSSLRNQFHVHLPGIRKELYRAVSRRGGYFPVSPDRVRRTWAGIGVAVLGAAALLGLSGLVAPGGALALAASGGVVLAFSRFMPRRTRKGREVYEEIAGFREFVRRVDADRLERLGGRSVERFERVLPYAVVLGVADAWADAFASIYTEPPRWYRSARYADGFAPRRFVGDLGQSLNSIGRTLASTPRSSGGSGFSGGSSGGGFGGGGGGSW